MKPVQSSETASAGEHIRHRKLVWALLALLVALLVATLAAAEPLGMADDEAPSATPAPRDTQPVPPTAPGVRPDAHAHALGLQLRELTIGERQVRELKSGVFVEHAVGASASAGVRPGDVITKVNGRPVAGVERFWQMAEAANWQFVLTVKRGEILISISLENG